MVENLLAKLPDLLSYIINAGVTFGSGTTWAGGLGSGKSPMKRRIIIHIARAAYITCQHTKTTKQYNIYLTIILISQL